MTAMKSKLYVRMTFVEGALLRLLGLATRRGFGIAYVHAHGGADGGWYEIVLELIGPRSIETLKRQIEKLYDVAVVEIVPSVQATVRAFNTQHVQAGHVAV